MSKIHEVFVIIKNKEIISLNGYTNLNFYDDKLCVERVKFVILYFTNSQVLEGQKLFK